MSTPAIPDGMTAVTREQFFAALYKDQRDIMPRHQEPLFTTWETNQRYVWGWSAPGWKNTGEFPAVYAVRASEIVS